MPAVDVDAMWDYGRPADSEARFRAALADAQGDDALVLRTQIARTYSLRGRYDDATRELDAMASSLPSAGAEPRVRALLERGRTLRSSGAPGAARPLFVQAYEAAHAARLEALAGDALHMIALAEPSLDGQLAWNRRTADYAKAHAGAARWLAPALNNMGSSLREAGRHADALATFRDALAAYEQRGKPDGVRFARWQVANTLRLLGRDDEALAAQLDLEKLCADAGEPDPYVFEELALLYEAKGDTARAAHYRERQAAVQQASP